MSLPEPADPIVPTPEPKAPGDGARPEWLTGADPSQFLGEAAIPESPRRLSLVAPRPDVAPVEEGDAPVSNARRETARAWTAAASSIPTLRRDAPAPPDMRAFDEDESEAHPALSDLPASAHDPAPAAPLQPLHEPWWIVGADELRTN